MRFVNHLFYVFIVMSLLVTGQAGAAKTSDQGLTSALLRCDGDIHSVSFSPNGRILAFTEWASNGKGQLHVLDTSTWKPCKHGIETKAESVHRVLFDEKGKSLFMVVWGKKGAAIVRRELETGRELVRFTHPDDPNFSLTGRGGMYLAKQGKVLFISEHGYDLNQDRNPDRRWKPILGGRNPIPGPTLAFDTATGKCLGEDIGGFLICGMDDKEAVIQEHKVIVRRLHDHRVLTEAKSLYHPSFLKEGAKQIVPSIYTGLAISRDGKRIVVVDAMGGLQLVETATGRVRYWFKLTIPGFNSRQRVDCVALYDNFVAIGSEGKLLVLDWDTITKRGGEDLWTAAGRTVLVPEATEVKTQPKVYLLSPDGSAALMLLSNREQCYSKRNGQWWFRKSGLHQTNDSGIGRIEAAVFSADSAWVAYTMRGRVHVFRTRGESKSNSFDVGANVTELRFLENGSVLETRDKDGTARTWDPLSGKDLTELRK